MASRSALLVQPVTEPRQEEKGRPCFVIATAVQRALPTASVLQAAAWAALLLFTLLIIVADV